MQMFFDEMLIIIFNLTKSVTFHGVGKYLLRIHKKLICQMQYFQAAFPPASKAAKTILAEIQEQYHLSTEDSKKIGVFQTKLTKYKKRSTQSLSMLK